MRGRSRDTGTRTDTATSAGVATDPATGLRLDAVTITVAGRTLLDTRSVTVPHGSSLAVTGPAGSGMTTVLRAVANITDVVDRAGAASAVGLEGRITLDGMPVRSQAVGVVTQQHDLLGGLSAAENVALPQLARGPLGPDGWSGVEALLGSLGLPESSWHNLVEQLSGGQQQRVAIARALAGSPALLCLDDPASELDGASRDAVWEVLQRARDAGAVLVIAGRDDALVERCDQVLRLG